MGIPSAAFFPKLPPRGNQDHLQLAEISIARGPSFYQPGYWSMRLAIIEISVSHKTPLHWWTLTNLLTNLTGAKENSSYLREKSSTIVQKNELLFPKLVSKTDLHRSQTIWERVCNTKFHFIYENGEQTTISYVDHSVWRLFRSKNYLSRLWIFQLKSWQPLPTVSS